MKKNIAVCLIATNKYKQFVDPLITSIKNNFLKKHNICVHVFTDDIGQCMERNAGNFFSYDPDRLTIIYHKIPSYGFPEATLLRYRIFSDAKSFLEKSDHVFYLDVDMRIENEVGDDILDGELTAVRHPGFFMNNGWGSPNVDPRSTAYILPPLRKKYFAGGFQGGQTESYLYVCDFLANNIDHDIKNSVMAEWHDESHWNAFLNYNMYTVRVRSLNELTPSYCMVEQIDLRGKWGILNLEPKIVALKKNHAELRS